SREREQAAAHAPETPRSQPLEAAEPELEQLPGYEQGEVAPSRPRRRSSERPPEDGPLFDLGAADAEPSAADGGWEAGAEGSGAQLSGMLFLNLGRRDGVRVAEVARLLRESCELSRAEVGRIRVRDRYTFVDVPSERLDSIIAALRGVTLHDKPLAPERAKTAKA
ncbi:MAG TPA: DbpA RNA binding domain-containing protein, partial [Polyangiales bacterium]|nr:DbpA RNA binding domain-containing protein [Polyangiales bacterium]